MVPECPTLLFSLVPYRALDDISESRLKGHNCLISIEIKPGEAGEFILEMTIGLEFRSLFEVSESVDKFRALPCANLLRPKSKRIPL